MKVAEQKTKAKQAGEEESVSLQRRVVSPTYLESRSDFFWQGWQASGNGVGRHRNPYAADTEQYNDWFDGWLMKFYGETI